MSTENISRAEAFKMAKQKRKEEKEKQSHNSEFGGDVFHYAPLETKKFRQFRVLGYPLHLRSVDKTGTSPKRILQSSILSDGGTRFRCIWPSREDDPNWILYDVYNTVMKYNWDAQAKRRDYVHEKTHPELFARCLHNNNPTNNYEKGWKAESVILMNVIDRERMDLHKELKHAFIMSSKASEMKNEPGKFYYKNGVPVSVYENLFDDVISGSGDQELYDVVIQKLDAAPWYKVFHAQKDAHRFEDEFPKYSSLKQYVTAPLTEEELSWTRYDFDKMFKVTPYHKIQTMLGKFIEQVDNEFGTSFTERLKTLVEKEAFDNPSAPPQEEQAVYEDDDSSDDNFDIKEEASAPVTEVRSSRSSRSTESSDASPSLKQAVESKNWALAASLGLPGLLKLSDEELSLIIGYDEKAEELQYHKDCKILECDECGYPAPDTFTICPKCGKSF